jgi:xanthine/uracil permease
LIGLIYAVGHSERAADADRAHTLRWMVWSLAASWFAWCVAVTWLARVFPPVFIGSVFVAALLSI